MTDTPENVRRMAAVLEWQWNGGPKPEPEGRLMGSDVIGALKRYAATLEAMTETMPDGRRLVWTPVPGMPPTTEARAKPPEEWAED